MNASQIHTRFRGFEGLRQHFVLSERAANGMSAEKEPQINKINKLGTYRFFASKIDQSYRTTIF